MTGALAQAPGDRLAPSHVLDRVAERAPWLAQRVAEVEGTRRVPDDVLDALRADGCLRLAVPAAYGGADLSLPQIVAVVEALARIGGTLGWIAGQVALAQAVLTYLPVDAVDELYAAGPDLYVAGAAAAKGRVARADGGWRVSGRWQLVSGCPRASWIYVQCVVAADDPAGAQDGAIPQLRAVLLPAAEVRIIETWNGVGLRGSESHDVHVKGATCPARHTCDLTGSPIVDATIARVAAPAQAGLVAAAVQTGIAASAVDAVLDLATRKRPAFSTRRLSEQPLFQDALGEAFCTLAAARSLLFAEVAAADAGPHDETVLRAVAPQVATLAAQVVDGAYTLAGSSSVPDGSVLARCLRDARSVSQHATLGRGFYGRVGALRAGAPPDGAL